MFFKGECFQVDSNISIHVYSSALLKIFGFRKHMLLKISDDSEELFEVWVASINIYCIRN